VDQPLSYTFSKKEGSELGQGVNTLITKIKSQEYCLIVLFFLLGSLLLISSADLITMYLSIELQSFSLYILAALYTDKFTSSSASLKYFLLGGLSSCIILFGIALIYSLTGLTNLDSIYALTSIFNAQALSLTISGFPPIEGNSEGLAIGPVTSQDPGLVLILGLFLIFSGLLFKISASPFHNWSLGPPIKIFKENFYYLLELST
jgi:NADH-ubiquinone oxidoreductase chain 2